MKWEIYTDGSTKGNGTNHAVGAWAYLVLKDGVENSRSCAGESNTTNQRMELSAAYYALEDTFDKILNTDEVIIYSDSAYLINCVLQKWWVNWQKNNWKNSRREPVANKDLWELLIPYFQQEQIKWEKVKGHAGQKYNEIVDNIAQTTAEEYRSENSNY